MPHGSEAIEQCIQACIDCHHACLETVAYCLTQGGQHAEPGHVELLLDCAQICQTSADFMLRDSEFHGQVCGVCAQVCDRCAMDCEQFGDNAEMQQCAKACRQCAESCRSMAA